MGSLTLYVNPPHWGFSSQIRAALGGVIHLHRIKKNIFVIQETWVTRPIQKSFNYLTHWAVNIQTGPQIYGRHGSLAHYSPDIHTIIKLNPTHQGMVLVMNWLDNLWVGLQTCNRVNFTLPRFQHGYQETGGELGERASLWTTCWYQHQSYITLEDILLCDFSIRTSLWKMWWYL